MPKTGSAPAEAGDDKRVNRFTVQLSDDLRPLLDQIKTAVSDAVQQATGVPFEASNAQVVSMLIKARAAELGASPQVSPDTP